MELSGLGARLQRAGPNKWRLSGQRESGNSTNIIKLIVPAKSAQY
jgi:hypothetical protein